MANEKEAEELREAARKRLPGGSKSKSANDYFRSAGMAYTSRSVSPRDHKIPMTRIDEDMAVRLASFGNANNLAMSESVRTLLDHSLSEWESTTVASSTTTEGDIPDVQEDQEDE